MSWLGDMVTPVGQRVDLFEIAPVIFGQNAKGLMWGFFGEFLLSFGYSFSIGPLGHLDQVMTAGRIDLFNPWFAVFVVLVCFLPTLKRNGWKIISFAVFTMVIVATVGGGAALISLFSNLMIALAGLFFIQEVTPDEEATTFSELAQAQGRLKSADTSLGNLLAEQAKAPPEKKAEYGKPITEAKVKKMDAVREFRKWNLNAVFLRTRQQMPKLTVVIPFLLLVILLFSLVFSAFAYLLAWTFGWFIPDSKNLVLIIGKILSICSLSTILAWLVAEVCSETHKVQGKLNLYSILVLNVVLFAGFVILYGLGGNFVPLVSGINPLVVLFSTLAISLVVVLRFSGIEKESQYRIWNGGFVSIALFGLFIVLLVLLWSTLFDILTSTAPTAASLQGGIFEDYVARIFRSEWIGNVFSFFQNGGFWYWTGNPIPSGLNGQEVADFFGKMPVDKKVFVQALSPESVSTDPEMVARARLELEYLKGIVWEPVSQALQLMMRLSLIIQIVLSIRFAGEISKLLVVFTPVSWLLPYKSHLTAVEQSFGNELINARSDGRMAEWINDQLVALTALVLSIYTSIVWLAIEGGNKLPTIQEVVNDPKMFTFLDRIIANLWLGVWKDASAKVFLPSYTLGLAAEADRLTWGFICGLSILVIPLGVYFAVAIVCHLQNRVLEEEEIKKAQKK